MIRPFNQRDIDYVIESHYQIYQREYQYDLTFKAFVESSLTRFLEKFDPERENLWILEVDQQPRGSICIEKIEADTAQLRFFLVEPAVRGQGFGHQLLKQAVDFCRDKDYQTLFLWTNRNLVTARRLYEKFGFFITETREQLLSNQNLVEERWELPLNRPGKD
ncbi:MAG: GNAT family N-acetyltransferase [Bacillaceae bacterium]|nr:GNAT family N-acetyltransferase [Bacillaceae bacterium]